MGWTAIDQDLVLGADDLVALAKTVSVQHANDPGNRRLFCINIELVGRPGGAQNDSICTNEVGRGSLAVLVGDQSFRMRDTYRVVSRYCGIPLALSTAFGPAL